LQWWSDEYDKLDTESSRASTSSSAAAADSKQVSSDAQPASCKFVQTEQSAALEVGIAEQKKLIQQLMMREIDMKYYIHLLQQELEKRSNEAVVSAARMREVESRLADIQSSEATERPASPPPSPPSPSLLQRHQLETEPEYKSENVYVMLLFLSIRPH